MAAETMMRTIVAVVTLLLAFGVVSSVSVRHVGADPPLIGLSPDSGPIGTSLDIYYSSWPAETEVRLYAAFSTERDAGYTGSADFVGPIAVVMSDADGHWETSIATNDIPALKIGEGPGYLFIRAEGDDLPSYLRNFMVRHFVVTSDGQRPSESGEIEVSLSMAEGEHADLALWGWRRVGSPYFTTSYGLVAIPFDPTVAGGNGEFEIVAVTSGGHEPVGPGTVNLSASAVLCLNPSCYPSAPIIPVHSALEVSVVNNEIVEANVVLGTLRSDESPTRQEPRIDPLVATAPLSEDGRTALIAGASVLLAILAAGAVGLGYRRARR